MGKEKKRKSDKQPTESTKQTKKEKRLKSLLQLDEEDFSKQLKSESDRASAVLGGAFVEACLEKVFRRRLPNFAEVEDRLLGSSSPLGTFSGKIVVARSLDWIDSDMRHDLDVIRDIRNTFAHEFDHRLSFNDQSIDAQCRNLLGPKKYLSTITEFDPHVASTVEKKVDGRWRFQVAVTFLGMLLNRFSGEGEPYQYLVWCRHAVACRYETPPSPAPTPPTA